MPTMLVFPSNKAQLKKLFSRAPHISLFIVCTTLLFCYFFSDDPPDRPFAVAFRPQTCDGCFQYVYNRILSPRVECGPGEVVDLVVLITTVPTEISARYALRSTWANVNRTESRNVRFLFLFGKRKSAEEQRILEEELTKFGDILQDDFEDNYYNLSIKVIMGYRWVMQSCKQAKFVMRTAGDNYVNIPQVLDLLRGQGGKLNKSMIGECFSPTLPFRWPYHKWAVSLKEYPHVHYPSYCVGTTFITSYTLMEDLVRISADVPFFPIEDVYFGMCMRQLRKYTFSSVKGFNLHPPKTSVGKCSMPETFYSIHPVKLLDMLQIWARCSSLYPDKSYTQTIAITRSSRRSSPSSKPMKLQNGLPT